MSRVNKTTNNLKKVWDWLDNASSNIENAVGNIDRMTEISEELKELTDRVLHSSYTINALKSEIGELLEEKHGWNWYEELNKGE